MSSKEDNRIYIMRRYFTLIEFLIVSFVIALDKAVFSSARWFSRLFQRGNRLELEKSGLPHQKATDKTRSIRHFEIKNNQNWRYLNEKKAIEQLSAAGNVYSILATAGGVFLG